ncbi:MAG: AmmeMemoRadiSam system protein B [Sedimentibacter sp.]
MSKLSKIIVALILFIIIIGSILIYNNKNKLANDNELQPYLNSGSKNLGCLYYNITDFINVPDYIIRQDVGTIRGCIVPHHLVAKNLIHEVFQNVNKNKYKTVVLIGPDHESVDKGKIFTTLSDWQTPTGILETDNEVTRELLKNSFVIENDYKLTIEHSTSSIIPFIKYYLEDARVVTLVLTKQVKLKDIDILVDALYKNINMDETLFIASVDFSHYLNLEQANKMDSISMEAIQNKDINKIMTFTNDNLDSPISIVTMLKMMDKAGIVNNTILNHSNSELILKKKIEETTSYITYLFYDDLMH